MTAFFELLARFAFDADEDRDDDWRPRRAPGKRTLTSRLPPRTPPVAPSPGVARPSAASSLSGDQSFLDSLLSDSDGLGSDRAPLEDAFGTSLAAVRLHRGPLAAEVAERLGARAFALGSDVVLPDTIGASERPFILAHEIAHVVQQSGGSGGSSGDAESSADAAAHAISIGARAPAQPSTGVAVARYATSAPPAPVQTPAPIGNQNAHRPTSSDPIAGRDAAVRRFAQGGTQSAEERPTITVRPGGAPPHFITSTDEAGRMVLGGTDKDILSTVVHYTPRLFHVIPAIAHDLALATTLREVHSLWTLYLQDAPQPTPWTSAVPVPFGAMRLPHGSAASQILWGIVNMHATHDDPGGAARRQSLIDAARARAPHLGNDGLALLAEGHAKKDRPKKQPPDPTVDDTPSAGKADESTHRQHALPPGDPERAPHRGRIQVQGAGLEISRKWAQATPRTKMDGLQDLMALRASLSRSELRDRDRAFDKAVRFIESTDYTAPPDLHRSFQNKEVIARKGSERVDVEIHMGRAFV